MDAPLHGQPSEKCSEGHSANLMGLAERKRGLQDRLREEMQMHIKEGRASVERNQERVDRIQQLREELRGEEDRLKGTNRKTDQAGEHNSSPLEELSQVEYTKLLERRQKLKEDHGSLIKEELMNMEKELGAEKAEGLQGEVLRLGRERRILVLQMEALRSEGEQAEADLEAQYKQHQQELNSLREESLQVFRTFRQVLEEQRRISEERYRTLLLEAIQDAVYLSSQNQQLQADNKQLRKALAELKDSLSMRGNPKGDQMGTQQ